MRLLPTGILCMFSFPLKALSSRTRFQVIIEKFNLLSHPGSPQFCTLLYLFFPCYKHKTGENTRVKYLTLFSLFCTLSFPCCDWQHSQRLPPDTPSVSICSSSVCFHRQKSLRITQFSNLNILTKKKTQMCY